jgi:hypothetical protein
MICPIVAILPVRNEASRIADTLAHYQGLLEGIPLYIVDAFSTDDTLAICKKHVININCSLHILQKENNGTTEDPDWMKWLTSFVPSDSYLFLSCSESIDLSVLNDIRCKMDKGYDLVYYNRQPLLWSHDISAVYSKIIDLILCRSTFRPICRCASSKALSIVETRIHDNWISQASLVKTAFVKNQSLQILHCKNPSVAVNLRKHLEYAKVEAAVDRRINFHLLRLCREFVYVLLLAVTFRLSRACFAELLMRISYRASIVCLILQEDVNKS